MIMESANLHHHHQHQHQNQQQNNQIQEHVQALVGSSPSSSTSSCLGHPNTQQYAWTPNVSLNNVNYNQTYNGLLLLQPQSMFHHHNGEQQQEQQENMHNNNINLSRIKQELSSSSSSSSSSSTLTTTQGFPKFTEMLSNTSKEDELSDLSEKLLLKTISSGFGDFFYSNASSFGSSSVRGSFSQIYPTINISNLSSSSSSSITTSNNNNNFDMNLEALDLLTSARFNSNNNFTNSSSHDHNLGFAIHQQPHHLQHSIATLQSPTSPTKPSPFSNEIASEPKRASGFIDSSKPPHVSAPKKSRLDSRPCPPFKVRKEKLGDRIAALQQLVAPFGKTDTASVLMEAIGYIKFLQNQVEIYYLQTLSVPYMKSSRNKTNRSNQGLISNEDTTEEPKRDLRSRGLCLVPLSCMSYVTNDGGGGGIWPPPPSYGGGT